MTAASRLRRPAPVIGAMVISLASASPAAAAAAEDSPAAGVPLGQVIGATAAAIVLAGALLIFGFGHRSGRIAVLGRLARFAGRIGGLPSWAALPAALAGVGAALAGFGMYWDIALHIDNGRDPGPFANPSHYLILGGLFTLFAAGWLAIVLPEGRPSPAAVRITGDWYAPVSGVLLILSASFGLLGFPADDLSHRMFGQDVTLWGPTHLMLLGGGAMAVLSILVILAEARLARGRRRAAAPEARGPVSQRAGRALRTLRLVAACGGLLAALSIFQAEFDYGIPQFRLLFHPVLIALFAAIALVPARVLGGRGAALGAVAVFLCLRLAMLLLPAGLEQTIPHFPLYLAAGAMVELAALIVGRERPYRLGILAGALIGSVGTLAEWGWSHVWMPIPWPAHMIGEALALSIAIGVAGGVIGGFLGGALRLRPEVTATRRAWLSVGAGLLVVAGVFAYLLPTTVPPGSRAAVSLTEVGDPPRRTAMATVRLRPPSIAENADWLTLTAGQGDAGPMVLDSLRPVGPGTYRTTEPFPVHGGWKAVIRLARGDVLAGVPVHAPADAAIPLPAIPAPAGFERPFVPDRENFQRERQLHVPAWMWPASISVVGALGLAFLLLAGWVLVRLARAAAPMRSVVVADGTAQPQRQAGRRRVAEGAVHA